MKTLYFLLVLGFVIDGEDYGNLLDVGGDVGDNDDGDGFDFDIGF
jgi:hypothetical protein